MLGCFFVWSWTPMIHEWMVWSHILWLQATAKKKVRSSMILVCSHLVGGLEHFLCFHILRMSSSQLTNSIIFQRGGEKTTNQPLFRWLIGPSLFLAGHFPFLAAPMGSPSHHKPPWGAWSGEIPWRSRRTVVAAKQCQTAVFTYVLTYFYQ